MKKLSTLDWLDAQLHNTLTPEERKELEKKLLQDPAFKQEFATLLAIRQAARDKERILLRERYFAKKNPRGINWSRWAAAATFIGALLVAWFLLRPGENLDLKELYAQYEQEESINLTYRSGKSSLSQAESLYQKGDFQGAVNFLDSFLLKNPDELKIQLYKGMALRQIEGKEQAAISLFVSLENKPVFKEEAQWQKALVYLKLGEVAACRAVLEGMDTARVRELLDVLP